MTGYTKLFGSILESTVWLESPPIKVVWITLLAMADRDGIIEASVPGLAKRAGVERGHCEQALAVFLAPDPDSRTTAHEGRRIEAVPGGWRLLNYDVYRARASAEEARDRAAARQRRHRERQALLSVTSVTVTRSNDIAPAPAPAPAEVKAGKERKNVSSETSSEPPSPAFLEFPVIGSEETDWPLTEAQVAEWVGLFPGLDVCGECRKALVWIRANAGHRKTAKGMLRFLARWLTKAVDERRGPMPGSAQPANRPPSSQASPAVADYWDKLGAKAKASA